jgi:hypothetical protein
MAGPTSPSLSRLFTQLMGRQVTFVPATPLPNTTAQQAYGIYTVFPDETAAIIQCDLSLLGAFAGALVGLPDSTVKEYLRAKPIEEILRDAMYEVLNVASSAISAEGRTVLTKMVTDPASIEGAAANTLKKPAHKYYFNVTVQGYQGGRFSILQ